MKKIINSYSKFVSLHPSLVIILCVVFTIITFYGMQLMKTETMDYKDMLPENYDAIKAYTLIEEEFGSTASGIIVIQIDNSYPNSNEHRSIVDPEVVLYSLNLENYAMHLTSVSSTNGFGNMVWKTYGFIPNDMNMLREIEYNFGSSYISKDESMALIRVSYDEEVNTEKATEEMLELIENINKPAGIKVSLTGEIFQDAIVDEQLGPDMSKTSMFSMIAIVIILLFMFRSIKSTIIPLTTIIFGVVWTMGFYGLIGKGLSSMTSGAVSMIMGIGIDFGIQVMSRYSQEQAKGHYKTQAMENTLNGITIPIFTTALACLIGFRAMGLGELSMMAEMGNIMSYGVIFCMIAALTIVPSLLLILTRTKK